MLGGIVRTVLTSALDQSGVVRAASSGLSSLILNGAKSYGFVLPQSKAEELARDLDGKRLDEATYLAESRLRALGIAPGTVIGAGPVEAPRQQLFASLPIQPVATPGGGGVDLWHQLEIERIGWSYEKRELTGKVEAAEARASTARLRHGPLWFLGGFGTAFALIGGIAFFSWLFVPRKGMA